VPDPTDTLAAYCAEHVALVIVLNNLVPATVSADPVEVITSVIESPKTSVPTTVTVFPLSPVPVVVTVTFLAPPEAKESFAIVNAVFGRAAAATKVVEAATSSLTVMA
jgi:hypothetical protein